MSSDPYLMDEQIDRETREMHRLQASRALSPVHECPVCDGQGMVYDPNDPSMSAYPTRVCHGCHGKGWVKV